jgi:hypothetical protein
VNKSWIYYKDVTFDLKAPHETPPGVGYVLCLD